VNHPGAYAQPGNAQPPGYPQPSYPQPGYSQQGYPQPGYPQTDYAQAPMSADEYAQYNRTRAARRKSNSSCCLHPAGCFLILSSAALIALILGMYFFLPFRTNILLLGMDYADPGSTVARTDTIILTTFQPHKPYIGMLSIPRDLWVNVPGVGENRINTAHFFAEAAQPGSGPAAAAQTIEENFGVKVDYHMRLRFEGFREIVDQLGGVDIELTEAMAGYPAGAHHLTGHKALAFVRDRADSDDFFRMQHGQVMLKAILKQIAKPQTWPRLPGALAALWNALDSNVPTVLWPRLGLALLRLGPEGVDNRMISREMVLPFTTNQGAMVLAPQWNLINPVLLEMFGE
jgi:LCP family protein required for cell wall assembly